MGTYYLREDEPPEGYERDERIYVAKIVVENDSSDSEAKTNIYWNEHPYSKVKNEKSFPLEIRKAWKVNGNAVEWPENHEVAYKVVRHTYLAIDPSWELDEMPEIESDRVENLSSGTLTADEPTAILENLPRTGLWTAPTPVPQEMLNYGIAPGQRCYVYYQYEVIEDAANSFKPANSPYTFTDQSVFTVDGQVTIEENNQTKTVDGQIGELVNRLASVTVKKNWSDGNDNHTGDSVKVQLYRYTTKPADSGDDIGDETIKLLLNTSWMYETGTDPASSDDIPTDGNIIVKVTGNGRTKRAILNADNNWTAQVPGLPKYDASKNLITYTAVIESVNKGTNIVSVENIGNPSFSFSETDQEKTLLGRVKTKEDLNETMEVTFDANWIDELNAAETPSSDAVITATITSTDGSTTIVELNNGNQFTSTVTLPRVSHGVAVTHTVSYSSGGTNVIANDVSGLTEFGGDTTAVHVTGKMKTVVTANKMNILVDASGVTSNDGNAWAFRLDASGELHTSDWQKKKHFTPKALNAGTTIAYANDLDLTEASGNTAVYMFSIAADHADITIRSDSPGVTITQNPYNSSVYDISITASAGEVKLYVESPGKLYSSQRRMSVRSEKLGSALGNSAAKTFSGNEIASSNLQLPEGAEVVGNEVTLDNVNNWQNSWPDLPATDEDGNKYYYYVKEVSATTAAGSRIIAINASYDYSRYGDAAEITVTNTPEYEVPSTVTISIQKQDADTEEPLPGAVFSLWKYDTEAQQYVQINGNVAVNENGQASVADLEVGSYELREEISPGGYNKLESSISFSINYEGTVEFTDTDLVQYQSLTFIVGNAPGAVLPSTGGHGTFLIYLTGMMLLGMSAAGMIVMKTHWKNME